MSSCNIKDRIIDNFEQKDILSKENNNLIVKDLIKFNEVEDEVRKQLSEKLKIDINYTLFETAYADDTYETLYAFVNEEVFDKLQNIIDKNDFDFDSFINNQIQTIDDFNAKTKYDKYLEYKYYILKEVDNKLVQIETLKKESDIIQDSERSQQILKEERKLIKLRNNLLKDISLIKSNEPAIALKLTAESELTEVEGLLDSTDASTIAFVHEILDFYSAIDLNQKSEQNRLENPLFKEDEIYDDKGNILLPLSMITVVEDIVREANRLKRKLYLKNRDIFKGLIDESEAGKKFTETTGEKFNVSELLNVGVRDIGTLDSLMLDVTVTLGSNNLVEAIPKIAHTIYSEEFAKSKAYSRGVLRRLNNITPLVAERLKELGYKVTTVRGKVILADYSIFYEVDEYGRKTNNLIRPFTSFYYKTKAKIDTVFKYDLDQYKSGDMEWSIFLKKKLLKRNWYRKNTIAINAAKLLDEDGTPLILNKESYGDVKLNYTEQERKEYKDWLISLIGEIGYKQVLKEQKAFVNQYEQSYATMNEEERKVLVKYHNPIRYAETQNEVGIDYKTEEIVNKQTGKTEKRIVPGIQKYNEIINYSTDYVSVIPAEYEKESVNEYEYRDTEKKSTYYNEFYTKINEKGNEPLLELYQIATEVIDFQKQIGDPHLNSQLGDFSLMRVEKTLIEIITDPELSKLQRIFEWFKEALNRLALKLGKNPRENLSQIKINPYTGKPIYQISTSWLNTNESMARSRTEAILLSLSEYLERKDGFSIINFNQKIDISKNIEVQRELAEIIGVTDLKDCKWIDLEDADLYEIVYQAELNNALMSQTMDLPRIISKYIDALATHNARNKVLADMNIIRNFYRDIPKMTKRKKSNLIEDSSDDDDLLYEEGVGITTNEIRKNAVKKFDNWFFSNILGIPYNTDQTVDMPGPNNLPSGLKNILEKINPHKNEDRINLATVDEIDGKKIYEDLTGRTSRQILKRKSKKFRDNIDRSIKRIHTERLQIEKELQDENLKPELRKKYENDLRAFKNTERRLISSRDELGVVFTLSAVWETLLNGVRYIGLGWNIVSQITNLLEGQLANSVMGAAGNYVSQESLTRANLIRWQSVFKFLNVFNFKVPKSAKKTRILMDRYDVLQDMSDEFKRSRTKSVYSQIEKFTDSFGFMQRTEYLNQFPLMVAMLMDTKIKGIDGQESSVWDAMDENGRLTSNFRTEENIDTWENGNTKEYGEFQTKLSQTIVATHGDYSLTRGNRLNDNEIFKIVMMFKRWFPRHFAKHFQTEQYNFDIEEEIKGSKRSMNYGTAGFYVFAMMLVPHGFTISTVIFPTLIGLAYKFSNFSQTKNRKPITKTGYVLKDMAQMMLDVSKDMLNSTGRLVGSKKGLDLEIKQGRLKRLDYQNYLTNVHEMSIMFTLGIATAILRSLIKIDDDEDDEEEKKNKTLASNLITNTMMQQMNSMIMYFNPVAMWNNLLEQPGVIRQATATSNFFDALNDKINGEDIYVTGLYAGRSKTEVAFQKAFLPSILRGWGGFEPRMMREFEQWGWGDYFLSDEKKAEKEIKQRKANMKSKINNNDELSDDEKVLLLKQLDKIYQKDQLENKRDQKARLDAYFEDNPDYMNVQEINRKEIMKEYGSEDYQERKKMSQSKSKNSRVKKRKIRRNLKQNKDD